ncbi:MULTISPECIES: DUF1877 family protein [unclassified Streptomyces]|uniref:DUF1877 family protein n=1 Tax=unclassified Streptomyces TaxID=2593676 RepID=UPI002250BAE7|nr:MULTISPECIES: DUF1877 family protein [unclassified Streptomyces]MCX5248501.1 YfbM family protein [Streptomyces sp. NBC_00201]
MSPYFHLRAVPPSALRNSANWLQRLFEDDWDTVRRRIDRYREEMLDRSYLDQNTLYAGADVILGGRPVPHPDPDEPPFLILTAALTARVAAFLEAADFETLWQSAREPLLRAYGGPDAEPQLHALFAATHRDMTAFYTRTAEYGDAVVKCLLH